MAESVRDILEQPKPSVDEKTRLRVLKERQNEERQRKLEEIKAQALSAQRFKEQKEQERRKRLEELRIKDEAKRVQVEERKKAITEAEKHRMEFILKRNQEREHRLEAKKRNERSNPVFAFGSSTPRMLEPVDLSVSFWGHRKATSIQNISTSTTSASSSLTRRQSERDLDVMNKKRATSATGLERSAETSSRPSSSLSQQSTNSVTSTTSVRHRISATPRKPRPISIAVTGITHDAKIEKRNDTKPPLPKTRKYVNKESAVAKNKLKSPIDNKKEIVEVKQHTDTDKQTIIAAPSVVTTSEVQKPPDVNSNVTTQLLPDIGEKTDMFLKKEKESNEVHVPEPKPSDIVLLPENLKKEDPKVEPKETEDVESQVEPPAEPVKEDKIIETKQKSVEKQVESEKSKNNAKPPTETSTENKESNANNEMTASMIKRINTEEEAKAAIAEKRRIIREEAERQAELERLRLEAEAKAELEKQQKEEEQVRQLIEMQRQAEQERLKEAIKEAQRKEEEERLKKEEEQKLKQLKEEAEKKAREDAERQKAELQERLKNEEKEREARRKRVEAIMLRTRGKNNANLSTQQNPDEKNENKADEQGRDDQENKVNGTKIIDRENGMTKNGKETEIVDNLIQSEIVKNANSIDSINSTDTLNSNNSWRESQQFGNFLVNNNN